MKNKVGIHNDICMELNGIYERKNADYGDSFGKGYKEYGMTMPCIRLEDKLNRLKSLTVHKNNQLVADESIEDTLFDLANYAIMTLIERRLSEHSKSKSLLSDFPREPITFLEPEASRTMALNIRPKACSQLDNKDL